MSEDNFIEAVVEKLITGGDGLARIDGMAHFIPGSLPGERVRARVIHQKKGWARTSEAEVLEASPHRQDPFCPVYKDCGGCSWQHIEPSFQVEAKTGFCREALIRQGGMISDNLPDFSIFTSPPKGYRARIKPLILPDGSAAFRAAGSGKAIEIRNCPVATKGINAFLAEPPKGLKPGTEPVVFASDSTASVQGLNHDAVAVVKGKEFRFPTGAFFQSNITILDDLVDFAVSTNGGGEYALDLYGGVGLFGAFLAEKFANIIGVDRDKNAKSSWKRHVGPKGVFHAISLEKWVKRSDSPKPDFVIVDPPRGGLDPTVCKALIKMAAPELSYVSCDPVTQARDLKILMAAGYKLTDYAVFDLYPQTPHVETVARLVLGVPG